MNEDHYSEWEYEIIHWKKNGHRSLIDENHLWHCIPEPALIVIDEGIVWYKHGLHHREDGPAYLTDTHLYWCANGKIHRIDGPAYAHKNGEIRWYLYGEYHSKFEEWLELTPLRIEEKIILKLRYG